MTRGLTFVALVVTLSFVATYWQLLADFLLGVGLALVHLEVRRRTDQRRARRRAVQRDDL